MGHTLQTLHCAFDPGAGAPRRQGRLLRGLVTIALAGACGGDDGGTTATPPPVDIVTVVAVSPSSASLLVGESLRLTAAARTASGSVLPGHSTSWQSNGPAVASVGSDGTVTAMAAGTAQITATIDGKSGSMSVTVQVPAKVHTIQLDYPNAMLALGQELRLQPLLLDSAGQRVTKTGLTWASSDTNVVRVDANGTVTATGEGQGIVRVSVDGVMQVSTVAVIAFASIRAGPNVTCALTRTGQAYCAGATLGFLATPVAGDLRFATIESDGLPTGGPWHICGITLDQKTYCWGDNRLGQLGVGDGTFRSTPTVVVGNHEFVQVSVGRAHACGLTGSGDAYCWGGNAIDVAWGSNERGALGVGDTLTRFQPTAVVGGHKFRQIEAGWGTTCGVTTTGDAYCWGRNELGQVGNGASLGGLEHNELTPQKVVGDLYFKQVATKGPRSCGLTENGTAYCWGNNTVYELGSKTAVAECYGRKACSSRPLAVETSSRFLALSTSQFATCGVTVDERTQCWGMNYQYLFGQELLNRDSGCPSVFGCAAVPVEGPSNLISISGGVEHFCGIGRNGIAYCWGGNSVGERGWLASASDPTPRPFSIAPRR